MDSMAEKTLSSERIFEGRALTVDVLKIAMPDGRETTREVLRHRGAVCILCEKDDGTFVFVKQHRKAVEQTLLECVAGCIDPGETPEEAALRETREESGYEVARLVALGKSLPAPGYCDEIHWHFYAKLKSQAGALDLDTDENLKPVTLTAQAIEEAIDNGTLTDGKTIILWDLYHRALRKAMV